MKFLIAYTDIICFRHLIYDIEENSFDTIPLVQEVNFDVVINYLNLTAVDNDNKIVQVWGVCGYKGWKKFNRDVPQYKVGVLKIMDNLEEGFSYRVSEDDFPVFVNIRTGWVCIGNPEKKGNAVEFINNCVAVIDDEKEFVSLWLKLEKLPDI